MSIYNVAEQGGMRGVSMYKLAKDGRRVTTARQLSRWVEDHLGGVSHERRVASIARRLVEESIGFHALDHRDVRLLRQAAIVHDVGRHAGEKHHPAIGAEMLLKDESLPLKNRHRRALAYMTLYHRGQVPELGKDVILRETDDAKRLRTLLAFLRAADGLDCRSLRAPKLDIRRWGRRLLITCKLREDCPKSRRVFSRRKKFRLLEEALGCRVVVHFHVSRRLRVAA
jgi:exopolyphosphatase/guanosine-5'-triphosphate,3'-diphosphate pyrophosphatase